MVPYTDSITNDSMFYHLDENGNIIPCNTAWYLMYQEFNRQGHEIHTIDMYSDWSEVDYFLLFPIEWIAAQAIAEAGYADRMIYCNAEPASVCELHTKEGYEILRQIFPYILTWNRECVDGRQVFQRCIPYLGEFSPCDIPFSERKLITGISANKHSTYAGELYTTREDAYSWFEEHYPDQFDFYGTRWAGTNHPCYKGVVDSKAETFHHYRFALCFENTRTSGDYITEKIWDCLYSQIVPIYVGAANIRDYIPEDCFIDYDRYASYEELAEYLLGIDESRYQEYLDAAQRLLHSDVKRQFSAEQGVVDILNAIAVPNDYHMTDYGRRFLKRKAKRDKRNLRGIAIRSGLKRLLWRHH